MSKRYALPALVALVTAFAVSAAAVAGDDDSNPPSDDGRQVTAVQQAAKDALSVLEQSRDGSDALPSELSDRIDADASFGMNPDLSQRAVANAVSSVFVIPADDHVCAALTLGDGGANLSCPSTADVAAGKAAPATVTLPTGGIAIYGLVPDGVGAVTVDAGEVARVAVEGNAYYTVVPAGTALRSVTYDGPSGVVEFPIVDPSAEAAQS